MKFLWLTIKANGICKYNVVIKLLKSKTAGILITILIIKTAEALISSELVRQKEGKFF